MAGAEPGLTDAFARVVLKPEGSRGEEYPFDVKEQVTKGRRGHPEDAGQIYYVVRARLETLMMMIESMNVKSEFDMSDASALQILEGAPYAHLGLHKPAADGVYEHPRTALSRGLHVKLTGTFRDRVRHLFDELGEIVMIQDMTRFIYPSKGSLPKEVVVTVFPDRMCG